MNEFSKDCFANRSPKKCTILTDKNCRLCKFYKTSEQYAYDRAKYKDKEIAFRESKKKEVI